MRASRRDVAKVSRHETWRILGVLAASALLTSGVSYAETTTAKAAPVTTTAKAAPVTTTAKAAPVTTTAKAAPVTTAAKAAPATTTAKAAPATTIAKPAMATTTAKPAMATAKAAPAPAKTTKTPATVPTAAAHPAKPTSAPNVTVATRPSPIVAAPNPKATVAKTTAVQPLPSIEEQVTYQYNALGRRDPFIPMVGGTFIGDDVGGDAPMDIGGMKVVGIVWGADDKFALVEDARGQSSVLRAGDKVMNGVVETLKRDAVVVNLTVDGQSESVSIPLTRKGDQTNGNR